MIHVIQIAFVFTGLFLLALLAFTLLVIYEQLGICLSSSDKIIALFSSAIGAIVGTQMLVGEVIPPLLLIAFLAGGLFQIWHSRDRSR